MDWTIGPLDHFFGPFFGPFFRPFYQGEADDEHLARGGMQSISTQGGVVGRPLLRRKGWRTNH